MADDTELTIELTPELLMLLNKRLSIENKQLKAEVERLRAQVAEMEAQRDADVRALCRAYEAIEYLEG